MTRINARIDRALAGKIRTLRARTGRSTTEIVKDSIEAYYTTVVGAEDPRDLLSDFIGCAEGPPNLSRDYKKILTDSLSRKMRL